MSTIEGRSEISAVRLELASFAFVVAMFTAINYTILSDAREINSQLPAAVGAWGVGMIFVLFYFTRYFDSKITNTRVRRFERRWKPRLLAFMQERGAQIMRAHTPAGTDDRRLARVAPSAPQHRTSFRGLGLQMTALPAKM